MREHFTWTTPMDTAFIEAMLKEQEKGNRPNGTFTSEAYTTMAEELSKITKLMQAKYEVWEALIKEKSDAANLRTKPIRHYNELMELFRKDRATGEASETAKERKNRMKQDEKPVETIDEIDELLETNEISLENFTTGDNEHVTPQVQDY
ncbi:Myb/SANT-like domain-containing protein [Tanacetum coccineum]